MKYKITGSNITVNTLLNFVKESDAVIDTVKSKQRIENKQVHTIGFKFPPYKMNEKRMSKMFNRHLVKNNLSHLINDGVDVEYITLKADKNNVDIESLSSSQLQIQLV